MKVYFNGELIGTWVKTDTDYEFVRLISGGDPGTAAVGALAVGGVASAYGAYENRKAASRATDTLNAQYAQTRADLMPYTEAGYKTTGTMMDLMGYNGKEAQDKAYAAFRTDPGYKFAFDQGQQAVERSAASKGGFFSGATGAALINYGQGMADQQFGNYYNRLFNISNMGRGTATGVAQMGQQVAGQVAGYGTERDTAISSGLNQFANQATNIAGVMYGRNRGTATNYYGYDPRF